MGAEEEEAKSASREIDWPPFELLAWFPLFKEGAAAGGIWAACGWDADDDALECNLAAGQ